MDFSKLPGKQWLVTAFACVIVGLLSLMWTFVPILLIVVGFLAFMYWMQKYGKKKPAATVAAPKPPEATVPPAPPKA